nr:VOC family protein [Gordonia sp. SID5947]
MTHGLPCWVDLATDDPESSTTFYHELLGWKYADHRGRIIAMCGDAPVAQITPTPSEATRCHSYWHVYFSSEPFEELARRSGATGGQLLSGPADIEGLARVISATDPAGAAFSLWEPLQFHGFDADVAGAPVWFELDTPDPVSIADFYRDLLDVDAIAAQLEHGPYHLFVSEGDVPVAGVRPTTGTTGWVSYFRTESLSRTIETAVDMDAEITLEETSLGSVGRIARLCDPVGAPFGLIELAPHSADPEPDPGAGRDDNAGFPTTLSL